MGIIDKINKSILKFYHSKQGLRVAFTTWCFLVAFFGYQLTQLKFDFDFENFFPVDHPDLETFNEFKNNFDYDNDFLLVVLRNRDGLFNTPFLKKVELTSRNIKNLPGTVEVLSPTDLRIPAKTSIGLAGISVLHPGVPKKLYADSIRIANRATIEKAFFSKDLTSLLIRIKHKHFVDVQASNNYSQRLGETLKKFEFDEVYVVGRVTVQAEFIQLIRSDFGKFIVLAFLIILAFLKWQYRSWKSVFVPFLLILSSIIVTLGLMVWLGYPLNILTVLTPTIISFVAISDVIHFYTKYQICLSDTSSEKEALLLTIKEIWPATFLTSLTTSLGFISLVTIKVLPIQLLGIFTAVGVMVAFLFTFILLPFFSKELVPSNTRGAQTWHRVSTFLFRLAYQQQEKILLGAFLLTIISVIGVFNLEIDAYLLDDLPQTSPSKKSFSYTDEKHGGTKPWNLVIKKTDGSSIYNLKNLQKLAVLEDYLIDHYGLFLLESPVNQIKFLNQIQNGGNSKYFTLPSQDAEIDQLKKLNKRLTASSPYQSVDFLKDYGRIAGFIPEWGSKETGKKDQKLKEYLQRSDHFNDLSFALTGTTYLIDRSHEFLSENLFWGLLFAFGTVSILTTLLFRSFRMLIIAVLPNMLPVLMIGAIIGFWGIPIKLTTSIIFAVSFGIAVDDTIHFISRFRMEINRRRMQEAVAYTFQSAGKAMIITTILLCLGFGIFCFSSFGATYFTGLFVVLTLISALFVDLLLLPVLLIKFYKK